MKNHKIIALIPARGGSKSIPKKNIIDLEGYPLIAFSIAAAKLSKSISRIIVSTDSEEIAEISRAYGAEVPFLRPKKFAQDTSRDIEAINHALLWLRAKENYSPDYVVFLRPTTPLRNIKLIDKAILEIINDKKATALRSASLSQHTAYKLFKKKGDYIDFFGKEDFKKGVEYYDFPRQVLPITYQPNGYVDVILPGTIEKTGTLHGKRIRAFITKKVADIDEIRDVKFAQKILKDKEYLPLINLLKKIKRS